MQPGHDFDLISIGECLAEFTRESDGRFRSAWAGDAVNALFYAGRLGLRTGFVSTFGDDPFTSMIRSGISAEGIDLAMTEVLPDRTNGLYFIETDAWGEYTFHFRRNDSAATETLRRIDPDRLFDYLSRSAWILFSGVTLAVMKEPSRLVRMLERLRESSGTRIAFDTNYRSALWPSADAYRAAVREIVPFVDLFLPSESDLHGAWPGLSPDEVRARFPVSTIALKRGRNGCVVYAHGERHEIPVENAADVVDTTGAGDAFNAGFITGLVAGLAPVDAARLGVRVAGKVVGVRGAIDPDFNGRGR